MLRLGMRAALGMSARPLLVRPALPRHSAAAAARDGCCRSPNTAASALRPVRRLTSIRPRGVLHQQSATSTESSRVSRDAVMTGKADNNIPGSIFEKIGVNLLLRPAHPLGILKGEIEKYFDMRYGPGAFIKYDDLVPIVSTTANFDEMLVPADHVSRSPNDTYYVDADTVLRCHTSAHQGEMLRRGHSSFLVSGDVYRRDEIDATHYPVFHQMEGVRVFEEADWEAAGSADGTQFALADLKGALEGLAQHLFGKVEMRWIDAYFPFTEPSLELEIFFNGKWLEVLGCGVMQPNILAASGRSGKAWAFGLGLERLAMVLFEIPDIRLFWSDDPRFTTQFTAGNMKSRFKSYSKYPPCYKDVSFWLAPKYTDNSMCEVVREIAGDLVESVVLVDEFVSPKKGASKCFRITYRSMERSLTDEEVNAMQERVRAELASQLGVTLR